MQSVNTLVKSHYIIHLSTCKLACIPQTVPCRHKNPFWLGQSTIYNQQSTSNQSLKSSTVGQQPKQQHVTTGPHPTWPTGGALPVPVSVSVLKCRWHLGVTLISEQAREGKRVRKGKRTAMEGIHHWGAINMILMPNVAQITESR